MDDPIVFEDPFAAELTSTGWRMVLRSRLLRQVLRKTIFAGMRPVQGQILVRSRYAEEKLEEAIASGLKQYVLVGAGLDSFALRRRDLERTVHIYELDHPASQHSKQERLAELRIELPKNLEFVAVDFEQETVADALARSSFAQEQPAFFSWLGTTGYLTHEAVFQTLRSIAAFAVPRSEMVFDYLIPAKIVSPEHRLAARKVTRFVRRRGEPLITVFDPQNLGEQVSEVGFELLESLGPREQEARYFAARGDDLVPIGFSHLAHLRVRP
jgi:methyltransferase (TIGR00027 family)